MEKIRMSLPDFVQKPIERVEGSCPAKLLHRGYPVEAELSMEAMLGEEVDRVIVEK
jgi:hypothetical protein